MSTHNNSPLIRVFIGYDRRMPVLFHVLSHSILKNASVPVAITPLVLSQFDGVLRRDINETQSTEFSFSRFLTPYLSGFEGWSLFIDNDMVFLDDIANLWALRDERFAVQVVKHQHEPAEGTKFLGEKQTSYAKKNWSSVMLFNNAKCRALTPEFVSSASGLQLHQFKWLGSDEEIGEIPHRWNHLVDYDPLLPVSEVSNLHYTSGGPYFEAFQDCDFAEAWTDARDSMLVVQERKLK
jgi:hypothetical protein